MIDASSAPKGWKLNMSPIISVLIPFFSANGGKNGEMRETVAEERKLVAKSNGNDII